MPSSARPCSVTSAQSCTGQHSRGTGHGFPKLAGYVVLADRYVGRRDQIVAGAAFRHVVTWPEWQAGRWCDVFEIRDFLIQRCFIYLDPDYAGKDTARYPWLAAG